MFSKIIRKLEGYLKINNFRWSNLPDGVYSINFHRIGNWETTRFDPCVFSCNTQQLEQYIVFFKQHFDIISIDELVALTNKKDKNIYGKYLVITFDDGYKDNFTEAFPLFLQYDIPACFFIATGLIGDKKLPWWDRIAYNYKINKFTSIKLKSWKTIVKYKGDDKDFVREILAAVKASQVPIEEQISEMEEVFPISGDLPTQEFMSWGNLREMVANGMDVGAHSHNHEILANLTQKEIIFELTHSKMLIEENLNYKVIALSYPVGSQNSYDETVIKTLKDTGYDIAFNFQPGVNVNLEKNRYDLRRFSVEPSTSIESLKKTLSYAKLY